MFVKNKLFFGFTFLCLLGSKLIILSDWRQEKQELAPNLVVHGTHETFDKIREVISSKQKGVYYRFGDGEVYFANGQDIMEHNYVKKASEELKEAFLMNGPTIIKAIPLYCRELGGWEPGMFPGNHEDNVQWCLNILKIAKPLWGAPITDVYSHVALHFSSTQYTQDCIKFLKFIKDHNCHIFIGSKNVSRDIVDLVFGKNCKFVQAPPRNAYSDIDRMEREILEKFENDGQYKIVITAVGVVGKILQKRLYNKLDNVFFFDFGSLISALCGRNTRWWIGLTHFGHEDFIRQMRQNGF